MKWLTNSFFQLNYLCLLLCLLCTGCIKELNFELGKQEDLVVIFGTLSDQPGKHLFRVTRTNAFEKQVDSEPISGAKLWVSDGQGQKYPLVELEPGTYMLRDTLFQAKTGETYQLEATLPGGEQFRSDPEMMPTPVKMDKAYPDVEVKDNDQTLLIYSDVNIPADPLGVFLRWEVTRVWRRTSVDLATLFQNYSRFRPPDVCYMTEDPELNAVRIFGSKRRDAFALRREEVARVEADYKFFERNAFVVTQYRISEHAHEYWRKIKLLGNLNGSIFDVPPATIRGNIYQVDKPAERILGYFEVAAVDTAYTFSDAWLFPQYIADPCRRDFTKFEWEPTFYFDPECAYCINIKGYSLEVPKFW